MQAVPPHAGSFIHMRMAYNAHACVCVYVCVSPQFPWRNGWFWSISKRELDAGRPDPFPYHTQLLKEVVPDLAK